jgi:hypothetical protein
VPEHDGNFHHRYTEHEADDDAHQCRDVGATVVRANRTISAQAWTTSARARVTRNATDMATSCSNRRFPPLPRRITINVLKNNDIA